MFPRSHFTHYLNSFLTEWYWKCLLRRHVCQGLAMILALLSVLVVWSELTFFNAQPVLSIFAIFVNLAKEYYDYLSIEVNYSSIQLKSITGVILFTFFFSAGFDCHYRLHVRVRLFDGAENPCTESVLSGTSPSNRRI